MSDHHNEQMIIVRAGGTGVATDFSNSLPEFNLLVNGVMIATQRITEPFDFNSLDTFYSFGHDGTAPVRSVEVRYFNDGAYHGVDKNLWIDWIAVGGHVFESEIDGYFTPDNPEPGRAGPREWLYWNGSLGFDVERLSDCPGDASTFCALIVDGETEASALAPDDSDWFTMGLTRGVEYVLSIDDSGLDGNWRLAAREADGDVIAEASGFSSESSASEYIRPVGDLLVVPLRSGRHFASLDVADSDRFAPYTFSLEERRPDDFAADTSTTGVATVGVIASGSLEYTFDYDMFAVPISAPGSYKLTMIEDLMLGAFVDVYEMDQNGALTYTQFDYGARVLTVEEPDTFFIRFGTDPSLGRGDYSFRFDEVLTPTEVIIIAGGTGGPVLAPLYDVFADGRSIGSGTIFDLQTNEDRRTNGTEYDSFLFKDFEQTPPERIEIRFYNDGRDPVSDEDINLFIDRIEVNGRAYEAETDGWFTPDNPGPDREGPREALWWNGVLSFDLDDALV